VPPLVIAHRTCPLHAPPNSLEGIRRAGELGADVVEVDVRRTLGGVPVLMHDHTPCRTAGLLWPVGLLPLAVFKRLRLRANGEPLPTVEDALRALPPGLRIALDVKHASAAAATLAMVRRLGVADRVLLWSSHRSAVRRLAAAAPDIEVSLLCDRVPMEARRRLLADVVALGARGLSTRWDAVDSEFVADAHALGIAVYAGCPDVSRQDEKLWLVDGMSTDWPDEARARIDAAG